MNPNQPPYGYPPQGPPPQGYPPQGPPPPGFNPNMQHPPMPGFNPNMPHPQQMPPYGQPGMPFPPQPPMGFNQPGMPPQGYPMQPKPGFMPPGNFVPYAPVPPNHQLGKYNLSKQAIKNSKGLFKKHDRDGSKTINMQELYPLLAEVFAAGGLPPPQPHDVNMLLQKYDVNRDAQLSKTEFKCMLKELGGHAKYDKNSIKDKKNKVKKDKKDKKKH